MLEGKNLGSPEEFWKYFQAISQIPRCSGKEEHIREYIKNEVDRFGFENQIDAAGNLIVNIPSNDPNVHLMILQSHMDMVCEKNENVAHNFSQDPLKLKTVEVADETWVTAEGTSLGADNGVGLALSLALMEKIYEKELQFDNINIRIIFTVNEEAGLTGALHIDKELIDGDYLINLDCMEADSIIIGSTDCRYTVINIKIKRDTNIQSDEVLVPVKVYVKGLLGGHSGIDIDKGRANAIKLVVEVLKKIDREMGLYLESVEGGESFNAIPREASASFYVNEKNLDKLKTFLTQTAERFKKRYEGFEEDIKIIYKELQKNSPKYEVFQKEIQTKILNILYLLPFGPIYWHPHLENLVHTSTNLGTLETKKNKIQIEMYHRSFDQQNILEISTGIDSLLELSNMRYKINEAGEFGVWNPEINTEFLKFSQNIYKTLYDKEPEIRSVHAVLECGIFKNKCPNLEIITMGPTIEACHSPDEKLNVNSVEKSWNFLKTLLKEIR
ncbi:MAG: beta-Ala-His dipeptidase [Candidatus Lokiarchaeota archaeon]|nr:beta-Ala-His dipeptidase [Candidatus Lokiarchaeota archaeon]